MNATTHSNCSKFAEFGLNNSHVRTSLGLLAALTYSAALMACSNNPATNSSDTSVADAAPDSIQLADTNVACDPGSPPSSLAPIHSTFTVIGGDAGVTIPTPDGTDPTGRWVAQNVTLYIPAEMAAALDLANSSLTGTAWFAFANGSYQYQSDMALRVVIPSQGALSSGLIGVARGTYAPPNPALQLTATCTSGEPVFDPISGFVRVDATHARFVTRIIIPAHGPGAEELPAMFDLVAAQ